MGSLLDVFPQAETLALAGIVIHREAFTHQLSPFVYILPRQPELDEVYLPRVKGVLSFFEPTHYLVGVAADDRYFRTRREIRTIQDAQSSITLAHQALCIYHCCPYVMGPIFGFQKGGSVPLVLQLPATAGANWELEDVAFSPPSGPFFPWHASNPFENGLNQFFETLSLAYSQVKDRRWIISATRFTSAINHPTAYAAILDLAVSVEALLNRQDQVGFSVRLYLALLVGENYGERKQIEEDMKRFYSLRSSLVHGNLPGVSTDESKLIGRVATYISRALKKTCGRRIDPDVFVDLDHLSLLGAPRYCRERTTIVMKPQELAELVSQMTGIGPYDSYRAFLTEPDDEGDQDLMIEFAREGTTLGPFEVTPYLVFSPRLKGVSRFSWWISRDDDGDLILAITCLP